MERFLLGAVAGAILALAVGAPLLASWPTRLRWLLAAPAMDPFLGLTSWSGLLMREVTVVQVSAHDDRVDVTLAEGAGRPPARLRSLVAGSPEPGLVAQLEGWCTIHLPLLLIVDEAGEAQLCGPEATTMGFRDVGERV
jgi:hypothetical protein